MRPFTLLIKPAGPDCNLACGYCFYTPKTEIFGSGRHRMSDEVLETMVKQYLANEMPVHMFAWQGGEPTLMGLDFYRRAVELQTQYGKVGRTVSNALQTNGILLDDQWGPFLHEYRFLVGISLDGPQEFHDYYRKDRRGEGTFTRVMAAIECCNKHEVDFNILVLLNDRNVTHPDELFDFFLDLGVKYLQFIPCVQRDPQTGDMAPYSITPEQYGDFLCRLFDRWRQYGPGMISIRMFDSILNYLVHGCHTICTFNPRCNDYIVIEHNGDAYACDFFVEPQWRLGNLLETQMEQLISGPVKQRFSQQKRDRANVCLTCRHHDICRGGCLKDRIVMANNPRQASYFCAAYRQFFDYAQEKFRGLAAGYIRP